jgi:hypothetical protein
VKRTSRLWLVLLAFAFIAGWTAAAAQSQAIELVPVGSFDSPVFVANPPGDAHRLFIVEKPGRVRIIRDGVTLAQPFLDIAADVSSVGERGLLSIAFPPDYSASGLFYVYYTDLEGDIRIDEFARSAVTPDLVDPSLDARCSRFRTQRSAACTRREIWLSRRHRIGTQDLARCSMTSAIGRDSNRELDTADAGFSGSVLSDGGWD